MEWFSSFCCSQQRAMLFTKLCYKYNTTEALCNATVKPTNLYLTKINITFNIFS